MLTYKVECIEDKLVSICYVYYKMHFDDKQTVHDQEDYNLIQYVITYQKENKHGLPDKFLKFSVQQSTQNLVSLLTNLEHGIPFILPTHPATNL